MDVDHYVRELGSGLGFQLWADAGCALGAITGSLNALCDRVEDRTERSVVLLRLSTAPVEGRSWPGEGDVQDVSRWEKAVRRLERLAAVTIAVAEGTCGGPALDLLLAADFRICTPDFRLLLPINDGHIWPGLAVYRLVQQLGAARARQIVLWSSETSVEQARAFGLVDQVTSDFPDAIHTAMILLGRVSDAELAVRRQLLFEASSTTYEEALGVHLAACDRELRRLADAGAGAETGAEV